jgi:hypothetical protein
MFDPVTGKMEVGDVTTLQALWAIRDSNARTKYKVVLTMLILRTKPTEDGWMCFPSLATIAKDTGLSRRCVMGVLDEFIVAGLISKTSGDRETSNTYIVDFPTVMRLVSHTPPKRRR